MRSVLAVLFNSPVLIVPLKSCFSIRPSSAPSPGTDVFCIRKTWEYLTGRRGNIRTRCIVDKNGPFSSLDIEVVVVVPGDGQVPHPPVVPLRGDAAVGGCQRAVRGLEVLTLRQFVRSNPLVQIRIPEQVGGGGADDRGAVAGLDGQVVEVGVVVKQDGGDPFRPGPCRSWCRTPLP